MKGDFANAIAEFRQGLRHDRSDPRDAFAWCHLAFAYNAQTPSDPKAAEEAARAAIRLQPGYFWSYVILGVALKLQARHEEAIAAYEYALQQNPDFHPALNSLGQLYYEQGKYEQALSAYDKFVSAGATNVYIRLFHFLLESRVGKFEEAQTQLRNFSIAANEDPWSKSVVRFYLGEIGENAFRERASNQDPQKERGQKCEAYYYLGMAYLLNLDVLLNSAAPDTVKAHEYFEKCLATNSTNYEYKFAKIELKRLRNIEELTYKK